MGVIEEEGSLGVIEEEGSLEVIEEEGSLGVIEVMKKNCHEGVIGIVGDCGFASGFLQDIYLNIHFYLNYMCAG